MTTNTPSDEQWLSEDAIIDQAAEIFYELASDNLPEAVIHRFNAEFPEFGYFESDEVDESWAELGALPEVVDALLQVEIGIEKPNNTAPFVLAKMLISRDPEEKFCHIEWLP